MKLRRGWFHHSLVVLIILTIPKGNAFAGDVGMGLGEWKNTFRATVDAVLMTYYARLAKTAADAEVALELDLDRLAMMGRIATVRIAQAKKSLGGEGRDAPGPSLRDARLTSQASRALADQAAYLDSIFKRIVLARGKQCSAAGVQDFVRSFKASGLINTRDIVDKLQQQIQNLAKAVKSDVTIAVGYDSHGGNHGHGFATATIAADGQGEQKQAALMAAFTAAGAYAGGAIGGTIGSLVPVAGTTVGALIGTLIGTLIGSILGTLFCGIFFSDPYVSAIKKVREQSDLVMQAVRSLDAENVAERAIGFCESYFRGKNLVTLTGKIETRWPLVMSEITANAAEVAATETAIEEEYVAELQRLRLLVYPTVQSLVNERFEACFAEIKRRSWESRKFAEERIPEPLRKIMERKTSPRDRLAAEARLWETVVEGDSKYSATRAFSFQESAAGESVETVAWDGYARTVYRRLDKVFFEVAK